MKVLVSSLLALLLGILAVGPGANRALAAEPIGHLSGVLKDTSGQAVAGAVIELRSLRSGEIVRQQSAADGHFAFNVAAERYLLVVRVEGFEPIEREVIVLASGRTSLDDLTLEIARMRVGVDVTAPPMTRPLVVEMDPRAARQPVPAQDGADYLKTVPGFSVIRKGGTDGDPILRGMAGSRLGVMLNGEQVLGGCGNRMDPPTAYVFPAAYERVIVVKGPQTVSHGPGNSAGVVLFEQAPTRYDTSTVSAYASPTVGSFGRNDVVAEVKAGTPAVYGVLNATRTAMEDYQDGAGQPVHSAYMRWSTNGTIGWTPAASTRVEVSGAMSDGHAAYADRTMDGAKFARENVGARFQRQNLSRAVASLEAQAFYNYVDHVMDNYSQRPFKASAMMPTPAVNNPDRRTVGGRLSSNLLLSMHTAATVGADLQQNRHSLRTSMNQPVDPYESHARISDANFENVGAYGEVTQHFGANTRIVGGARADWWTAEDRRQFINVGSGAMAKPSPNPTAGLTRHSTLGSGFARLEQEVGSGATAYAGVGHARRAPDYWELFNKESAQTLSAFDTRPERTTQVDAGLRYRRNRFSGSASLFASTVGDYILIESNYVKTAMGMGGTVTSRKATITRNIDARTWGGEAVFGVDLTRELKVDTSLAYVRGENRTDDRPLAQQPPLEGRLGLQYAGGRWSVGALTRLVAAQDRFALNQGNIVGQDLGPTPAFAVFSLNGGWRAARFAFISVGVDNLFDANYSEFVSRNGADVAGFTMTTRVNEPGRTAWVKLDLRK